MSSIKHTLMVLSGKGGVGKSTVASQLAFALAAQGNQVAVRRVCDWNRLESSISISADPAFLV